MPGIGKTLDEFKAGKLHSGSKKGPVVKSKAQALAIGLSEARKAGENVAKPKDHAKQPTPHHSGHHSFATSNQPFGQTKGGEEAAHHIEQGHKLHGPMGHAHDGAGRKGHDMEMHHNTEHKTPHHPEGSHTREGYISESDGVAGHPGEVARLAHDGSLIGDNYSQTAHEPAVLKTPDGQGFTAGHPGIHAGIGTKPHGYGHAAHQRSGMLRNSGHPGAHRIGKGR